MENFIALSGYAESGKDTVADYLGERYGYTKVAFADPLRDFAWAVNPIVEYGQDGPIRYQDALETYGYTEAKMLFPELRELLQRIGTEGARGVFGDSFWVDLAGKEADKHDLVAVPDCRFPNEAEWVVDDADGVVVWISRVGNDAVNTHASDNSLNEWDFNYVLTNDGSFDELYEQIDEMMLEFNLPLVKTILK